MRSLDKRKIIYIIKFLYLSKLLFSWDSVSIFSKFFLYLLISWLHLKLFESIHNYHRIGYLFF